jgi:hypothetical protein
MRQCEGQQVISMPTMAVRPTSPRSAPMSSGQQRAMAKVRSDKAKVATGRSVLSEMDFTGVYCVRCSHLCSGSHHPGTMGRCKRKGCNCLMCEVTCSCGDSSADHEPFGAEVSIACQVCANCKAFSPTHYNPNT